MDDVNIRKHSNRLSLNGSFNWSISLFFYLEGRVHEARVAQITETTQARLRLGLSVVVGGAV